MATRANRCEGPGPGEWQHRVKTDATGRGSGSGRQAVKGPGEVAAEVDLAVRADRGSTTRYLARAQLLLQTGMYETRSNGCEGPGEWQHKVKTDATGRGSGSGRQAEKGPGEVVAEVELAADASCQCCQLSPPSNGLAWF